MWFYVDMSGASKGGGLVAVLICLVSPFIFAIGGAIAAIIINKKNWIATAICAVVSLYFTLALIQVIGKSVRDGNEYKRLENMRSDLSLITLEISDKENIDTDTFEFSYTFKNGTPFRIIETEIEMNVYNYQGNQLMSTSIVDIDCFAGAEKDYILRVTAESVDENVEELYNTPYDYLTFEIVFKLIKYNDDLEYYVFNDARTVKVADAEALENEYQIACEKLEGRQYSEAKTIFERLGNYKDSFEKINICNNGIYGIEQQKKEVKYQEAITKFENGDYVGAVILFKEIADYKDSQETVDYIYENAVSISLNYSAEGQYQAAVDLLEGLGYTDDLYDSNTPDDVYRALTANKEAINGDYARLISLGFVDFVIPNGVTEIASGAFQNCTSLKSIVIPHTVISIGDNAFYGCSSLREVVIPDSVTTIGVTAFYGCSSLSDIELSDNLTTIAGGAFAGCNSLSSITLPNKLSVIGAQAFYGCSGIRKFMIPESVTFIGDEAFDKCNNLSEISMPAIEGFELRNMFSYMSTPSSLVRVNITSGTRLGKRFFYQCQTLSEINLPNGLEVIGEEAFSSCTATTINIPDTVREIQSEAFSYSSIKNFKLPANVTVISSSMFAYSQLTKIELHSNVSYIESGAFHDCSVSITFDGTRDEWLALDKDSLWNSGMSSYKVICDDSTFIHKPGYTDSWS